MCIPQKYITHSINLRDGSVLPGYNEIYNELKTLDPEDYLQIILNAETDEEKEFYNSVSDIVLQQAQKKVIESGLF